MNIDSEGTTRAHSRRQFFRGSSAFVGAGTLAGLGLNLAPAAAAAQKLKIKGAREVPSVCPYCAVGCGQIVSVARWSDRQYRGQSRQPDQRRHALPQGRRELSACRQSQPPHEGQVSRTLRDRVGRKEPRLGDGPDRRARQSHAQTRPLPSFGKATMRQASLSRSASIIAPRSRRWAGATMDNEWNYVQLKLWRALGLIWLENQARI